MDGLARSIRQGMYWVAVLLMLSSLVRLGLEPSYWSPRYAAWLGLIVLYAAGHLWLLRNPTTTHLRAAMLLNFVGINVGYNMIGLALHSSTGWRADEWLRQFDRWIFSGDPQRFLALIQSPWLSVLAMAGYLAFFCILVYLFLAEAFVLTETTGRLQLALMRVYGIGFSGYLLMPAAGPGTHHPESLHSIAHSPFTAWAHREVLKNCSGVDVFPSLHAAVCCFTLVWTFREHRRAFRLWIAPAAALLLGTVYFQYHYTIDLLLGALLGIIAALSVSHEKTPPILPSAGSPG
jgi:hypothetical protein